MSEKKKKQKEPKTPDPEVKKPTLAEDKKKDKKAANGNGGFKWMSPKFFMIFHHRYIII